MTNIIGVQRMKQITGKLSNVTVMNKEGSPYVAWGNISEDVHVRWVDGTRIHTSQIKSIEGDIITTLNSTYKVVGGITYKEYPYDS